jgi:hypothetical protein
VGIKGEAGDVPCIKLLTRIRMRMCRYVLVACFVGHEYTRDDQDSRSITRDHGQRDIGTRHQAPSQPTQPPTPQPQ